MCNNPVNIVPPPALSVWITVLSARGLEASRGVAACESVSAALSDTTFFVFSGHGCEPFDLSQMVRDPRGQLDAVMAAASFERIEQCYRPTADDAGVFVLVTHAPQRVEHLDMLSHITASLSHLQLPLTPLCRAARLNLDPSGQLRTAFGDDGKFHAISRMGLSVLQSALMRLDAGARAARTQQGAELLESIGLLRGPVTEELFAQAKRAENHPRPGISTLLLAERYLKALYQWQVPLVDSLVRQFNPEEEIVTAQN